MMAHPAFDTLRFVQRLKAAGVPEPQAVAITEAQNEALMESTDHMLATKTDIFDLKQELKQDVTDLRTEFRTEFIEVKSNLKLHHWMIGFVLTGIAALIIKTFF